MKIGIVITLAMLGLATMLTSTPAKAQHQARPLPAVVVFGATEDYQDDKPYPVGYVIYVVSSSPNAPRIESGTQMSTAMEFLITQGFEIQQSAGFRFIAIRK